MIHGGAVVGLAAADGTVCLLNGTVVQLRSNGTVGKFTGLLDLLPSTRT